MSNTAFYDNDALYGAGIYSENAIATVSNSTFSGNAATSIGGGIFSREASWTVTNSTFSGNSALYSGGGIYGYQEIGTNTITVTNSTFSANSVTEATGCGAGICNMTGTLNLKNTILANSTAGLDCESYFAAFTGINNLIESHYECGTPISSANTQLGSLANNGGTTQTFALLPGSPAIDKGDDTTCVAAPVNGLDRAGAARTYGTHCDIGAYELEKGQPDLLFDRHVRRVYLKSARTPLLAAA